MTKKEDLVNLTLTMHVESETEECSKIFDGFGQINKGTNDTKKRRR